ncbi:MAG: MFS transporter [Bryobacterales bacterium]|nr:MFS transporter [Bryobacterales bacterium]
MNRDTFRPFHSPDFRLLWIGACTSTIGTWMQTQAQNWLVLEISRNPYYLGLDAFLGQIPIFMFTLAGGVIADRVDRRYVLVGSQIVQMTCAIVLALLFQLGLVQVWHILSLSFVVGTAQAFGGPAYQALIPSLVSKDDVPAAIALNSIQFNLARMIGPALGLLALTRLGPAWCFYLNGFSYLAVIATLLLIRSSFRPQSGQGSVLASLKQGFAFIQNQPVMPSLIVMAFLMTMLGIPLMTFLPVFARDIYKQGPNGYTMLLEVAGAGSILGALLVAGFHKGRQKGKIALINLMLLGLGVIVFALSRNLIVSYVVLFLGSAALISVFALISSLVQEVTTHEMRGRVMSVYNMAFRGGMPFGSLLSGKFVEGFGAPLVVAVNGALLIVLGGYFLLFRKRVASL